MLGPQACFGWDAYSPQSPVYDETLARCTHTVYPLDFSGQQHTGGLLCFFGFGHVICIWEVKVCPCIALEARSTTKP
jgi:hypothetical protein